MKNKLIITIITLSLAATLLLGTGCSNDNKNKTIEEKNNNVTTEQKEENKIGEEEKRILAGEVIEYKFDSNNKSGKVAELDLDLDGNKETIELGKISRDAETDVESLEIKVNDSAVKFEEFTIKQVVSAVAFDDKHILLATYANGMSDDYHTSFYMYSDKKLEKVGDIGNDIRELNKKVDGKEVLKYTDGILESIEQGGTLSTRVIVKYMWDGSKLSISTDETFDYANQDEKIKVIKPIKLYKEAKKDSKSKEISPSVIYPIKRGDESWNYIKTEEGKEGWIDASECYECFEQLNIAG